jgi:hypothetical protein
MVRTVRGVARELTYELRREVGVDEVSETFRAYRYDEVKPSLTIKGSLPPPAAASAVPPAAPARPGPSGPAVDGNPHPAAELAAPAAPESAPPKAPEV